MKMSYSVRKYLSRVLVAVLLFTQLVVAVHACMLAAAADSALPGNRVVSSEPSAHCQEMSKQSDTSPDKAKVCTAHCHSGQQSSNTTIPMLAALGSASFYQLTIMVAEFSTAGAYSVSLLRLATAPPHAILHCCFRL